MLPDFIDIKTVYLITHLFGIAIGAGGAFASDLIFFKSTRDGHISPTEFGFLKLGGNMVWIGLGILIVSGLLLFSLDSEVYSASSKFQVKMTIVGIIIINGIILHTKFIPKFKEMTFDKTASITEYIYSNPFVLVSGVVSMISWSSVIILGALRGIPYSYWLGVGVYGAVVVCGIGAVLVLHSILFPKSK